jgi:hypothetical protein
MKRKSPYFLLKGYPLTILGFEVEFVITRSIKIYLVMELPCLDPLSIWT